MKQQPGGTVTITAPDERSLVDFIYLKILSEENAVYTTEFDELPECTINVEDTFSRSTVEKALCVYTQGPLRGKPRAPSIF